MATNNLPDKSKKDSEDPKLTAIKKQAKALGLTVHHKASYETIKEQVDAELLARAKEFDKTIPPKAAKTDGKIKTLHEKATELVRIRVTNMNPDKRKWPGEIISAGNARIGMFKKYVPFNHEGGWHVPKIIFNAMKERKYQQHYTVQERGREVPKTKLMPEFNIEVLDPLTPQELKDLAIKQAREQGLDQ